MRDNVRSSHVRALLMVLVAIFLVIPLLPPEPGIGSGAIAVEIVLALALASGLYAVGTNKRLRILVAGTLVPAVILGTMEELGWIPTRPWGVLAFALYGLGFVVVGIAMSHHLLRERRVTFDTIASALATYLLFGLIWAVVYRFFEAFDPDAFAGLVPEVELGLGELGQKSQFKALLYFSFTTLTTLGYGDILPVNPVVRSLAVLEAAFGQIYLAILVARLVGIHTARAMTDD